VTRVSGLSVASPSRSFGPDEMLELVGLSGDDFARRIFARSGIRQRQFELSPSVLRSTLQGRTPATEEQRMRLATASIDRLEFDPATGTGWAPASTSTIWSASVAPARCRCSGWRARCCAPGRGGRRWWSRRRA
jgi:hypothetical protein